MYFYFAKEFFYELLGNRYLPKTRRKYKLICNYLSNSMLRIATWNINGIRSFSQQQFQEALLQIDADIVCLQETKITRKFHLILCRRRII